MKLLKYQFLVEVNHGTEEKPNIEQIFRNRTVKCSDDVFEAWLAIAQSEAYNGEVTVEEVPDPETPEDPTDGELESRVAAVETEVDELTAAIEKGLSL